MRRNSRGLTQALGRMKPYLPLILLLMVFLFAQRADAADAIDLGLSFRSAKTESQRLRVAIAAIDQKIICVGCSINMLNAVFSAGFSPEDTSGENNGIYSSVVFLRPDLAGLNRPASHQAGRKNWLFAGSEIAGQRAAAIMSLLATAKGRDPHA